MNHAIQTAIFLLFISIANAGAQSKSQWSIETDPSTFVFNGYAVHLRFQPANLERWLFGIGTYSMDLPDLMVDMNPNNKAKGWELRIDQGLGFFTEYYFKSGNQGFFVGEQLGLQRFKLKKAEQVNQQTRYTNLLFMSYGGYSWHPLKKSIPGLYLKPWGGVGLTTNIEGEARIAEESYEIASLIPFVTLHIGYSF